MSVHFVTIWSDHGNIVDCGHQHSTVGEAESCTSRLDASVRAIEDGEERSLNDEEMEVLTVHLGMKYGNLRLQ